MTADTSSLIVTAPSTFASIAWHSSTGRSRTTMFTAWMSSWIWTMPLPSQSPMQLIGVEVGVGVGGTVWVAVAGTVAVAVSTTAVVAVRVGVADAVAATV